MTRMPALNLLPGARSRAGRSAGLGLLLGMLMAAAWLQHRQAALQALLAQEQQLLAERAPLAQALQQAAEQARQQQAAAQAQAAARALQARQLQWLAVLEDLAQAPAARLSLVRLDDQGLTVHARVALPELAAWSQARATPGSGLLAPQWLDLSAPPPGQAGPPGVQVVVRWPLAQGAGP